MSLLAATGVTRYAVAALAVLLVVVVVLASPSASGPWSPLGTSDGDTTRGDLSRAVLPCMTLNAALKTQQNATISQLTVARASLAATSQRAADAEQRFAASQGELAKVRAQLEVAVRAVTELSHNLSRIVAEQASAPASASVPAPSVEKAHSCAAEFAPLPPLLPCATDRHSDLAAAAARVAEPMRWGRRLVTFVSGALYVVGIGGRVDE